MNEGPKNQHNDNQQAKAQLPKIKDGFGAKLREGKNI